MSSTPITLMTMRLPPSIGEKTSATITSAGRLSVADPCTVANVPLTPAPRRHSDAATGAMHAEQSVITGPTARPRRVPLHTSPDSRSVLDLGNRNASVRPAIRKANVIPTATRRRYSTEKLHQRSTKEVSGSDSMQKPWKHSTTGALTTARSSRTVSSFGKRLNARNSANSATASTMPTARFFPSELLSKASLACIPQTYMVSLFKETRQSYPRLSVRAKPVAPLLRCGLT